MSGLVSGIGKVFSTVGNAATRVASSVLGVGAATQTAAVATGAGSMASGGLNGFLSNLTGGGVLGNVVSGAIKQAGYGALLGGIVGAVTGQGFGKGALMGAAGGALTGGLMAGMRTQPTGTISADTPTGLSPTGSTNPGGLDPSIPTGGSYLVTGPGQAAATAAKTAASTSTVPASSAGGFPSFLNSETGGGLLAGLGKGASDYFTMKTKIDAEKDMQERELGYLRDKDQRIQDSYSVADSSFAAPPGKMRYEYDPKQGKIVMVGA